MLSSDDVTRSMDWMSRGACQLEDPELFFPIASEGSAPEQINAAKQICLCCAVRRECLAFGLTTRPDGIWGGTTKGERTAIRRRPARLAALTTGWPVPQAPARQRSRRTVSTVPAPDQFRCGQP
jgi:WhiB family transcriptional regulator, redox-sensing transcriptional regulator